MDWVTECVIPPTPLSANKITVQARLRHFYPSNFDREPFPPKRPPSQDASARAGDLWTSVDLNLNLSKGIPGKAPCQLKLLNPPTPLCQAATLEQFPPHQKKSKCQSENREKTHHSGKGVHCTLTSHQKRAMPGVAFQKGGSLCKHWNENHPNHSIHIITTRWTLACTSTLATSPMPLSIHNQDHFLWTHLLTPPCSELSLLHSLSLPHHTLNAAQFSSNSKPFLHFYLIYIYIGSDQNDFLFLSSTKIF